MKNILILTGSPRRDGNSELLADAFMEGAESAGNKVFKFECANKVIRPCIACNTCYSAGSPCTLDDDFNLLAPYIQNADAIVFACPLYWFTFPSSIKLVIDKFYAFLMGNVDISKKDAYLLACGEDININAFDGLILTYKQIVNYLDWEDKGQIIVPNVRYIGDIKGSSVLIHTKELGAGV